MTASSAQPASLVGVPASLSFWLPLGFLALFFAVGITAPDFYDAYMETEFGVVENLTALLVVVAIVIGFFALRLALDKSARAETIWLILFLVACLLFLGEEISWGQHFIGWDAGGIFAERGQAETNIHNLHPFLSRASRALVVTAILIAGVVLPLTGIGKALARRLPGPQAFWLWALPAKSCALTAILILAAKLPKRIYRWSGLEADHWPGLNDNELLEVFVAHFMLIYALLLYRRLRYGAWP